MKKQIKTTLAMLFELAPSVSGAVYSSVTEELVYSEEGSDDGYSISDNTSDDAKELLLSAVGISEKITFERIDRQSNRI